MACELSRSVIVYAESEKSQLEKDTEWCVKNVCLWGYILYPGSQFGWASVLFLSPGGREADSESIGRWMRCGRSGKLRGVAQPADANARVRDAREAV